MAELLASFVAFTILVLIFLAVIYAIVWWGKNRKNSVKLKTLEPLKTYFEIAAFGFGALFIVIQLFSGQMNASMEVSLLLKREVVPNSADEDYLAVTINLKRSAIGRLMINDVVLDVTDINNPGNNRQLIRDSKVITERGICQDQSTTCQTNGVYLPPSDATQFAYLVKVKHGVPILVDSTILASRTGQFWAKPQWRTSAVSLPIVHLGSDD